MLKELESVASVTFTGTIDEITTLRVNVGRWKHLTAGYPKIAMTKEIKETTGMGLLESKQLAERLISLLPPTN